MRTFSHEFVHFCEKWNPIQYNEFRRLVFDRMGERGVDVDGLILEKQALYDGLSYEAAIREVVAEAMVDILPDSRFMEELYSKHKGVFNKLVARLKEFVASLKAHFKALTKSTDRGAAALKEQLGNDIRYFEDIVKAYDKMALGAVENYQEADTKKAAEDGGVQEQIRYTTDNTPVVIVTQDILQGVPKADWVNTVKNTISTKFSKGIPISGRLIKVNLTTKNEFTNSKNSKHYRRYDRQIYRDKYRSANNLDEIVLASTNYVNEDLNHKRKDSIVEFARGDVLMRIGTNDYSAKVVVGFTSGKNMVLYDIVDFNNTSFKLKKVGTHTAQTQNVQSSRTSAPTGNSISKSVSIVNSNSQNSAASSASTTQTNSNTTPKQRRTETLSDREILYRAAEGLNALELSEGEKSALDIFKKNLDELETLQMQREELGHLYREQMFTKGGDRTEASKTHNRMQTLDSQIKKASEELFSIEDKDILQKVLSEARKVVEAEGRAKTKETIRRMRDRRDNREPPKVFRLSGYPDHPSELSLGGRFRHCFIFSSLNE